MSQTLEDAQALADAVALFLRYAKKKPEHCERYLEAALDEAKKIPEKIERVIVERELGDLEVLANGEDGKGRKVP